MLKTFPIWKSKQQQKKQFLVSRHLISIPGPLAPTLFQSRWRVSRRRSCLRPSRRRCCSRSRRWQWWWCCHRCCSAGSGTAAWSRCGPPSTEPNAWLGSCFSAYSRDKEDFICQNWYLCDIYISGDSPWYYCLSIIWPRFTISVCLLWRLDRKFHFLLVDMRCWLEKCTIQQSIAQPEKEKRGMLFMLCTNNALHACSHDNDETR